MFATARWVTTFLAMLAMGSVPVAAAVPVTNALIRYPDTHGETIVFVARNTLWTVGTGGGIATRLAGVPAEPVAPYFSPDGRWIAFTAKERGNDDVFVIPATGGVPRRLTWSADASTSPRAWWGPNNRVVAWTPDSKGIVFLSRKSVVSRSQPRLYRVDLAGGLPRATAYEDAVAFSYADDGSSVAFTRTYTEYRPWKRYDGGLAPDIFVHDPRRGTTRRLTDWKGTDAFPMWAGERIFFVSDRDANRRANLWVMDSTGDHVRPLTRFTDQDIDFPSLGDGRIAFQQAGKLWLYDIRDDMLRTVSVEVPDDGAATKPQEVDASAMIRQTDVTNRVDYAIAPDGHAVLFSAMGDLYRVDADGRTTALTQTDGIDEDHPAWSPDGQSIAYATDRSGEEQIVTRRLDGTKETPLTRSKTGYYYTPVWSEDGRSLLAADAGHGLWLLHADGRDPRRIAFDPRAEIRDASFSPDGRYVAYSTMGANAQSVLHLYDVAHATDSTPGSPMHGDSQPRFAADGKTLFFLSNRHSQPVMSDRETDMVPVRSTGLYRVSIRDGQVRMQDALPLPLVGGTYELIGERGGDLFVLEKPAATPDGALEGDVLRLHRIDVASGKDEVVSQGGESLDVARDGGTLVRFDGMTYRWVDVRSGQTRPVTLSGMRSRVVWQHAWRNMFEKAWRLQRDMYYSPTMDGVDWRHVHDTLASLLPLVASRSDFDYLIGQLQGEVGSSHTYYDSGATVARHEPEALLGIDLVFDPGVGLYRIDRIVPGDNSRPSLRSPLQAPGVEAHDGDYLVAIQGTPLSPSRNPDERLAGVTGDVSLTLARAPGGATWNVSVQPLTSEVPLRQYDFIERSRAMVDRLSHGRLAYVYLADMSGLGTRQFIEQFYPQQDKQGLIVDVRGNAGGFTSQLLLERLRRERVGTFLNRQGACTPLPDGSIAGPKAVLVNHYSASDGDQFPYYFRQYGLGPVIGTRTWGGVRGILGAWPLMDGTSVNVPKDVLVTPTGDRLIENEGTHPDIEVDAEVTGGDDVQLRRAVDELLPALRSPTEGTCR